MGTPSRSSVAFRTCATHRAIFSEACVTLGDEHVLLPQLCLPDLEEPNFPISRRKQVHALLSIRITLVIAKLELTCPISFTCLVTKGNLYLPKGGNQFLRRDRKVQITISPPRGSSHWLVW